LPYLALLNVISWAAVEFTSIKIDILGPSDRLIVLRKLDAWNNNKNNQSNRPEKSIVFISSSLGIAAANMADYQKYGTPNPSAQLAMEYSQYRSLDEQIASTTGHKTQTINFSNVASMISEDLLVAKEAVRLHGKPSLMVLAIAPRDFLDHYTAAYHRSRLAQILITRQAESLWQNGKSNQENLDSLMCKIWPFYSQRVEYRDLLIKIACQSFNRSESLFSATKRLKNTAPTEAAPADLVAERREQRENQSSQTLALSDDIASDDKLVKFDNDYKGRYLPIDTDRWKLEMESLQSFAKFCQDKKIPLLIVTMPITTRNQKLLPSDFLANHMKAVNKIATSSSSNFLDLMADQRFSDSDFSDTVHLRSTGSIKLTKIITDEIQQQHLLP
jgi:hypothetical protein